MKMFFLILSAIYANDEPLSLRAFQQMVFKAMEAAQDDITQQEKLSRLYRHLQNPEHILTFYSKNSLHCLTIKNIEDFRPFSKFIFCDRYYCFAFVTENGEICYNCQNPCRLLKSSLNKEKHNYSTEIEWEKKNQKILNDLSNLPLKICFIFVFCIVTMRIFLNFSLLFMF